MRMSCNGCRVLRKGCGEDCSIRPCLSWIESSESQSNATLFLAKFYGRAGLLNLLNSGEDRFRPAMFRSLLHEACGRIVNPIYGSVGLLWSGKWHLCQAAVQAVLNGNPITPIDAGATGGAAAQGPPMNFGDIRHGARDNKSIGSKRRRSTRSGDCSAVESHGGECSAVESGGGDSDRDGAWCADEVKPTSCESETESVLSTEEMGRAEVEEAQEEDGPDGRVGLELTLGFGPGPVKKRRVD